MDDHDLQAEWQRLISMMPETVKAPIPLQLWNRERLYMLTLPVHKMPVSEFHWMLDIPLWAIDGTPFKVTPNAVLTDPKTFVEQFNRTLGADLSWPIHVLRHNNRWTILDGVHRLLKATMAGRTVIDAKIVSDADFSSIIETG